MSQDARGAPAKRYDVRLQGAEHLERLTSARVVFHGVNKSGSLAMSNTLRDCYAHAGRSAQLFSHYHNEPPRLDDLLALVHRAGSGHQLFIAHYLYGAIDAPDVRYVSQVRHPLPRALSAYNWLRNKHIRQHGSADGFPDLETHVRRTGGKNHAQYVNFGIGFGENAIVTRRAMSCDEIYERAIRVADETFHWIGLAEYFEESIFVMCHLLGLPSVAPWQRDRRNEDRMRLAALPPATKDLIEQVYEHDFRFYAHVKKRFLSRLRGVDFGPHFEEYKRICIGEYRDRLT